jgi:hypothetical protein
MPYDNQMGGGMDPGAEQPMETSPQSAAPEGEEQQGEQPDESKGYTCFLPGDFPGAENLKSGDTITLKVVGKDKDGDIEVQHTGEGQEKPMAEQGMMGHFDQEVGNK